MKSAKSLAAAYLLDWAVGDPEWMPHPVRIIGAGTQAGERLLRRFGKTPRYEIASGGFLTVSLTIGSGLLAHWLIRKLTHRSRSLGAAFEIALASTCLATRNLLDETSSVLTALERGDLIAAREKLSRIVGRDTDLLDESEICRAVIETIAESLSDGIVAPLFYLLIGGVPFAMAYKAINTLDSMIGHKDDRYFYFGRVAARLDDAANYFPARITALLICTTTLLTEPPALRPAVSTWLSDGHKHASPNAGQPESAMAGALQVKLGGTNTYQGEVINAPIMGEQFPEPSVSSARRAWKRGALVSLLGFGVAVLALRALKHD